MENLDGRKTYIAAAAAITTAAIGFMTGSADLFDTLQLAFTAILAVCVRRGIKVDTFSL